MKKHLILEMLFFIFVAMKKTALLVLIFLSCASITAQELPLWLEGIWAVSQEESSFSVYDEWRLSEDKTMLLSTTFRLFGNDSIIFDRKKIFIKNKQVVLQMKTQKDDTSIDYCYVGDEVEKGIWKFSSNEDISPSAIFYRRLDDNTVTLWTEMLSSEESCSEVLMYRQK